MKKLWTIRTADFFNSKNGLPANVQISHAGTIWIDLFLTDEEKSNYKCPIWQTGT